MKRPYAITSPHGHDTVFVDARDPKRALHAALAELGISGTVRPPCHKDRGTPRWRVLGTQADVCAPPTWLYVVEP